MIQILSWYNMRVAPWLHTQCAHKPLHRYKIWSKSWVDTTYESHLGYYHLRTRSHARILFQMLMWREIRHVSLLYYISSYCTSTYYLHTRSRARIRTWQVLVARGDSEGAKEAFKAAYNITRKCSGEGTPATLAVRRLVDQTPSTTAELEQTYAVSARLCSCVHASQPLTIISYLCS
jgi:hypothetical protein